MRNHKHKPLRRILSAMLTIIMALALAVPAFAAEIPTDRPDLEIIAALFVDWDGSYELPDLSELSESDQEIVKAMVDAAMLAREAENQAENQTETHDETPAVTSFSDVPTTHGFYDAIMWAAGKGIVGGYSDGTFRPANPVTRAQFCVMLSRAFYPSDVQKYNTEFYTKQGWFVPNTRALYSNGVLASTSFVSGFATASVMDQPISRYDMAQLMVNIMAKKGFTATTAQKTEAQAKITDYKSIESKYREAVKTVYALGIIGGYSDGSFKGDVTMNRGQGAVVIYRMAKYTPATNTGTPDTNDEGKPITNPGTSAGNTGNTGSTSTSSGNTGSTSTGSSSTGTTTTTKPETPTVKTLRNGQPITETNVLKLLNELQSKYPDGTNFASGYTSTMRQSIGGGISSDINAAINTYTGANGGKCSTTSGCGGWAAFVSDYIFGTSGLPARRTSFNNTRPGDIVVNVNDQGKLTHVSIAITSPHHDNECDFIEIMETGAETHNGVYEVDWQERSVVYDDGFLANNVQVWTRYPN